MKLNLNPAPAVSDEELCRLSREGDRDAFGQSCFAASATEAGTEAAKNWFVTQWWPDFVELIMHHAHSWILGSLILVLIGKHWVTQADGK